MSKFIIEESPPLKGRVKISGCKNAALPIMAAALMSPKRCVIHGVPGLTDIFVMQNIIESFGGKTEWDKKAETMSVTAPNAGGFDADYELISKIRASFLVLGPLLARFKKVRTVLPGGCAIGGRPVDLHLKGLSMLGADISLAHGYVEASAHKLAGADIYLDFPSVGATENIMMAAVLAQGQTILRNCAMEPEIVDLADFLVSIGADITGAGTDTLTIRGVEELRGGEYTIIPDRIEAGTFIVAACNVCGSDITLENAGMVNLMPVIAKLREMGAEIWEENGLLRAKSPEGRLKSANIKTLPYPGFPTDMQAQFMALLSVASGRSMVVETIFENRFMHVGELARMGACVKVESRTAVVDGVEKLNGCPVKATDLRAGAALTVAALAAKGTTEITDIYHLERGYDQLDEKLRQLGVKIIRVD